MPNKLSIVSEDHAGCSPVAPQAFPTLESPASLFYKNDETPVWSSLSASERLVMSEKFLNEDASPNVVSSGKEYQDLFSDKVFTRSNENNFMRTRLALDMSYAAILNVLRNHPTKFLCAHCSLQRMKVPSRGKLFWKLMTILDDKSFDDLMREISSVNGTVTSDITATFASQIDRFMFSKKSDLADMATDYYERCLKLLKAAEERENKDPDYFNFCDPVGNIRLLLSGMDDLYIVFLFILEDCAEE